MRKDVFILFCFLAVSTSCNTAENAKPQDSVRAIESNRQQTGDSQQTNSAQPSPQPAEQPNSIKSPTVVNSSGQNITYSTEGGLEIVGDEINYDILLPSDILFDFDKHELRPEARDLLQKLKAHFDAHKTDQVHIFGHTDSKGEDRYNAVLSQKRAVTVQKWLKENTGVYAMAAGMGEREPLVPNENPDGGDNPENRQRNRRVAVRVAVYPDINEMLDKNKHK